MNKTKDHSEGHIKNHLMSRASSKWTLPLLSSNFSRNHITSCVLNAIVCKEPALRVGGGHAHEELFLLCGLKSKASKSQRLSFQF